MKKTTVFLVSLLFAVNYSFAQNNCSKFYPMEEGSSFQYTNYDKKGKPDGTVDYRISSVSQDGSATVATFDLRYTDKKGKNLFDSNYTISCEDGTVRIDYESLFPAQMMQQYSEMDVEMDISGTDIELPNALDVGQELPDANVSIAMSMGGIKMNTTIDQMNRKVAKKESVTVAAGTFDCYLVQETSVSKTMGATIEVNSNMWLAEGVGLVKQESYKKNGNLMSRTELTKFSK
ncbi:hypothetical protein FGM00_01675 [Aggregatimonas sangjinii]|uniref:DUF3108 domain-containing protein n=1 Tax=Aggregatimonas sangjinii TaxID=2583587 RepID=A0A5B7SPH1_9FLAO|nr:hypothetical protein [Aggregatimonas sangjinii]QCW98892.1 hypothetical protein FGM00_01675 [Aggregatimonas sangjinii]